MMMLYRGPDSDPDVAHVRYGAGIRVHRDEVTRCIHVDNIAENSEAARDARIQAGDMLLAVNDKSVSGMHPSDVWELLHGDRHSQMTVQVNRGNEQFITVQLVRELAVRRHASITVDKSQAHLSLGLVLTRDESGRLVVKGLAHDSPAENSKMVRVGDVLDCLDNVTMRGKHPDEVQQTKLSNSRSVLLLTREGQPLPPVTLVYAHARLGIGIHVKRDSSTNLIQVAHIQTNSPADRSGLIHVGDVIDAVHYRPESRLAFRVTHVTGMHPEDVHDLLKVQRDHHITLFMNRNRWDPMNRAQDIKYTVRLQQIGHEVPMSDSEEEDDAEKAPEVVLVAGETEVTNISDMASEGRQKMASDGDSTKDRSELATVLTGSLLKRGARNSAWKRRFVVLHAEERVLRYYLDEKAYKASQKPKGAIPLTVRSSERDNLVLADAAEQASVTSDISSSSRGHVSKMDGGLQRLAVSPAHTVVEVLLSGPMHYVFAVRSGTDQQVADKQAGGRVFFWRAESLAEMDNWIDAISHCVAGEGGADGTVRGRGRTTGMVEKRGGVNTAFKSRFFTIDEGRLEYYADEVAFAAGKPPNGSISLTGTGFHHTSRVEVVAGGEDRQFLVHTPAEPRKTREMLVCRAVNEADRQRWITAIEREVLRCSLGKEEVVKEEEAVEAVEAPTWQQKREEKEKEFARHKAAHAQSMQRMDAMLQHVREKRRMCEEERAKNASQPLARGASIPEEEEEAGQEGEASRVGTSGSASANREGAKQSGAGRFSGRGKVSAARAVERERGVTQQLLSLLVTGKEDVRDLQTKREVAAALVAHTHRLSADATFATLWQHQRALQLCESARDLHAQQPPRACGADSGLEKGDLLAPDAARVSRSLEIFVQRVLVFGAGRPAEVQEELTVPVRSTDSLLAFQQRLAERFGQRVPPHLQRLVFADSVLHVDEQGNEARDGFRDKPKRGWGAIKQVFQEKSQTLDECRISHHATVHVLTPADTLNFRWKLIVFSRASEGTWRPGEKVEEIENLVHRAHQSQRSLERLRQRLRLLQTTGTLQLDSISVPRYVDSTQDCGDDDLALAVDWKVIKSGNAGMEQKETAMGVEKAALPCQKPVTGVDIVRTQSELVAAETHLLQGILRDETERERLLASVVDEVSRQLPSKPVVKLGSFAAPPPPPPPQEAGSNEPLNDIGMPPLQDPRGQTRSDGKEGWQLMTVAKASSAHRIAESNMVFHIRRLQTELEVARFNATQAVSAAQGLRSKAIGSR